MERETTEGVVDWTSRRLRVNGVGTPEITSPTAAITPRDLYEAARDDARARLERALAALPVDDARRVGDVAALEPRRRLAVQGFTSGDARHFSDGTVHMPAVLSFDWVVDALGAPVAAPAPVGAATGLVVLARTPARPALRLRLEADDGKRFVYAGLRTDPVGASGVSWVAARSEADTTLVGKAPLVLEATVPAEGRPGVLRLGAAETKLLFGDAPSAALPGGVVVVTK